LIEEDHNVNPFEYVCPEKVEDVPGLLDRKRGRTTALMAGGIDLLGEMKDNLTSPERLVNLKTIPELKFLKHTKPGLRIGATTTLTELVNDPEIQSGYAAIAEAAESVGSLQIRNVGTVGGNLCQRPRCWYYRAEEYVCLKKGGWQCFAYEGNNKYNAIIAGGPSYIVHPSDLAPALIALGALVKIHGPSGGREMALEDFYIHPEERLNHETVLRPNEVLTEVFVPRQNKNARTTYLKFKEKGSMDWALSAVAAVLTMDGQKIKDARIVLGGVAPIPWVVDSAPTILSGKRLDASILDQLADAAVEDAEPLAYNGYKIPLTRTLVKRAVQALVDGRSSDRG
jgi:xanthine dehydrogenase YagS FAD-binding subunit